MSFNVSRRDTPNGRYFEEVTQDSSEFNIVAHFLTKMLLLAYEGGIIFYGASLPGQK